MTLRISAAQLELFCCPGCLHRDGGGFSSLEPREGGLGCSRCRRFFPVAAGIPDLRPEGADPAALRFYDQGYVEETYGREDQSEHVGPLRHWLASAPVDGLVLELGTGLGALQDSHPAYVGTDLSMEVLSRRIRRPAFASDAEALPLRDGVVDALFTVAVLEHIPHPERALAEIARVLAPGGIAYLAPAWNCRPWASEGLHVRPWKDLTVTQRLRKTTIPLRDTLAWRGALAIPRRVVREVAFRASGEPTALRYRRLEANYEVFWAADSDATASLDPHEVGLYFRSRDFTVIAPGGLAGGLFHRAQPLVIRRPRP